jgi:SAM-dependent methyltransferase
MFASAKRAAWKYAPEFTYYAKEWWLEVAGRDRSPDEVFSEVYRNNLWGGDAGELHSGPGSEGVAATSFVAWVSNFIAEHRVESVVDLGCGDFRVGRRLLKPGLTYVGVDVVPALIEYNTVEYGSDRVKFRLRDIIRDELPQGDLCILRQVLQHLSNAQIHATLAKLSRYKYSIVAEHHPAPQRLRAPNVDKRLGPNTRIHCGSGIFLDEAPFSMHATLQARLPIASEVEAGETLGVYVIETL